MMLADTSAWIAYQRTEVTPTSAALRSAIDEDRVATTDIIALELLAGIDPSRVEKWEALLATAKHVPQLAWSDALAAASIYRTCRRNGVTPRSLVDCLVSAIAVRAELTVLHNDRDYDAIASCCDVRVARQ
jgi:predicted nucleic acid-binding protein